MTIDGEKFERPDNVAIPDTGTSLCLVSDDMCKKIYAKIPGAKCVPTRCEANLIQVRSS